MVLVLACIVAKPIRKNNLFYYYVADMKPNFEYQLLDFGNQKRLEVFGGHTVLRPAPQAMGQDISVPENTNIQAVCERNGSQNFWTDASTFPNPWHVKFQNLTLILKPSSHQVGIFPEQLENWLWTQEKLTMAHRPVKILNLFGYTGMASLAAASAHTNVRVCHVDGAKSTIKWAKENADLNGLSGQIRWICEDVTKFIKKEVRRGSAYDGIILDPPAFGRGPGGEWKLERDLEPLLKMLSQLLTPNPLFVVLSCHHPDWFPQDLEALLKKHFKHQFSQTESLDLAIVAASKKVFRLSICARMSNGL